MKLIDLHDFLNPARVVVLDAADFSIALPYLGGCALKLKSADGQVLVHETPEEIEALLKAPD